MQNERLPSECDVIVIGSGIAGLTATALLAKSGLSVVLLEKQSRPGGYFMGFKRKGFVFDSSIQWLNGCNATGFVGRIFEYIGSDYPKCIMSDRIRRYKGESFDYLLTSDPYELRDRLIYDFPAETEGIKRFFEDCKKIGVHFGKLNGCLRANQTMPEIERMIFGIKMLAWAVPVWKYLRISAEKGLDRYFKNNEIKKIFCSEEKFMSIIMPIGWVFVNDLLFPPEGGAEVFVKWLCGKIYNSSSRIFLNSSVKNVLLKNKTAAGVSLSDGRFINSRYIIAACDVENLYERMLPEGAVHSKMIRRLREADLYCSSVTIFIGLDCDASALGLYGELLYLTADNIPRKDHAGGDPYKNSLVIQSPSARDKTLAPEGKSTMTIHCSARIDYGDFWKTDKNMERGKAYGEFKRKYADILIERVEKSFGINIKKHIEVIEIATPVTYWRYTGNRNGSAMGASPTDKNIRNRLAHYKTPVKNLFLGGHWAEYGGGMPMAVKAASNASLMILEKTNKEEYEKLRNIMDFK
ncbi:MAG: NAD(P)/FAD-dependent oxidoreductase [Desulfobacteraceae bacterium]|nr:MAG: NAD(P)/FAD-dependent oxidoreductase [Desulfobacteraceae bacterium]